MKSIILYYLILFLTFSSPMAFSENGFSKKTGKDIYENCIAASSYLNEVKSIEESYDKVRMMAECVSWLNATNDAIYMISGFDAKVEIPYCIPDNLTLLNKINNLLAFIGNHPESLSAHAAVVIFTANITLYPCKPSGSH